MYADHSRFHRIYYVRFNIMKFFMTVLLLATLTAALISLSGCATREYTMLTKQVGEYGIQRFEDKDKNVVCYVYRDADNGAMSCLKSVK